MPAHRLASLPQALISLTRPINWNATRLTFKEAYGIFHRSLDPVAHKLIENVFAVSADQDRLHFAEQYATLVLGVTDLSDAKWFRRGVWVKETVPTTKYVEQRDHSVHTLHNYLLGWYFLVNSSLVRRQFQRAFAARGMRTNAGSLIAQFGEVWCFASLLHDIGYLFEGMLPKESMALVDEGVRDGAKWANEYFQEVFWDELNVRSVDERKALRKLTGITPDHLAEGGAGTIVQFLKDLGPLNDLGAAIDSELHGSFSNQFPLPSDAISIWAAHYRAFGQESMARRMEGLERALYGLVKDGIPGIPVRVLDHGVAGGLLLLKGSTHWFKFIFALKNANPPKGSKEARLRRRVLPLLKLDDYFAEHWWKSIVWTTAAVAIHNIQQGRRAPEWKMGGKLTIAEDPLAYLGILVDILQEWDRHSTRRIRSIEEGLRRINSGDVRIGKTARGRIAIVYGCRDENHRTRLSNMRRALDQALHDWEKIVTIRFEPSDARASPRVYRRRARRSSARSRALRPRYG